MSSSSNTLKRALAVVGKVSKAHVKEANKGTGGMWVAALDIAEQTVKAEYPSVTGMMIAGAKAHQSHEIKSHSNVISVKYLEGDTRVISGHVHVNGRVDYSKKARSNPSGERWQPTRSQVDQNTWTIYDPEKRKRRDVLSENDWWYIEKGGDKIWFWPDNDIALELHPFQ